MMDEDKEADRRRCCNEVCDIRASCARQNDADFDAEPKMFNGGRPEGTYCTSFVLRRALGRGNPDLVFTESRRRGKRHNAHAHTEPRKEFPASEALFGAKLANALRGKRRGNDSQLQQPKPKLKRPDLMVSRHIRDGRNINEKE